MICSTTAARRWRKALAGLLLLVPIASSLLRAVDQGWVPSNDEAQIVLRARDVPALLMSGYPDQGEVFATSSPFRMIAKPFTAEVLTGAVRDTLERAPL